MKRNWTEYSTQLVKRGEILIDPDILDTQSQLQQTKKANTLSDYPKKLFREMGIAIELPNFRTIHYRHSKEKFHFDCFPEDLLGIVSGKVVDMRLTDSRFMTFGVI